MPDGEVNIMKRWSEPQLAQTTLHERIFGGARIDHGNRRLIVAGDEKSLMLQCCGPELYRNNNSEEFQSRDVRRGVEEKSGKGNVRLLSRHVTPPRVRQASVVKGKSAKDQSAGLITETPL